ncbi:MAG TPA: MarR family winged helix-turn-helix transcriptional regulator [Rhizomicrobium sp.]|nr:MarR family winged helix-turn-helix transcriptional regulator [Rhizomicrobium sp.]
MQKGTPAFARILSAISKLQGSAGDISLPGVTVFFHICERDGIGLKELIFVSGFSESLVSRAVDRLAREGGRSGLVRVVKNPKDRRQRFVYLTEKGHALRDQLAETLSP